MQSTKFTKVYIVEKKQGGHDCDIVAMYDCGSIDMVCDFQSVFQDKVNFNIFINEQLEYLRCAKLQDVLHFLKEVIKDQEKFYGKGKSWRRLKPLYKLLKGFNNPQWNVTNKFGTYEMLVVRCEY